MKIKLPVTWEMCGIVEVEADSVEDAIENFDPDAHKLPQNGEYVDASFDLTSNEKEFIELFQK